MKRKTVYLLDELKSRLEAEAPRGAIFTGGDVKACAGLVERYADQDIGVTDASLVLLADRYGTHTICTLDRRHFGSLRALDGHPFQVLP